MTICLSTTNFGEKRSLFCACLGQHDPVTHALFQDRDGLLGLWTRTLKELLRTDEPAFLNLFTSSLLGASSARVTANCSTDGPLSELHVLTERVLFVAAGQLI